MDKLPQKTFITIIIFYLAALICFFIFSIYSFTSVDIVGKALENPEAHGLNMDISILRENAEAEIQILSNFKINWILSNSLKLFIQYLLPIQSTALIVAFSLIFPWKLGTQGMQIPFVDIIGKSIFLFLILTLVFSGLTEGLLPGTLKRQSDQLYLTQMATGYFDQATNELYSDNKEKNYNYIVTKLKAYLQIDPGNPVVEGTLDWAESTFDIKTDIPNITNKNDKITDGRKAADLELKASDYFSKEDYFSALYYANLAFKLDESRSGAQRIAAESREAIRSLAPDKSELEAKEKFNIKRTGFDLLNEGNSIEAYYIFKELSVESNTDKDIPEFLARSLEAISDKSFFIDEAEQYLFVPGINDIVFMDNKNTLIYIEKMVLLNGGKAFFFNIELIELDNSNKIIKHFSAPYGKFNSESESIIMNAIDQDHDNISYKPVYHTGTDREPENTILKLSPNLLDLKYIGQPGNTIKFMNIFELFKYGSIFSKYGYIQKPTQFLILERIVKPFTFLIISFLSVSLGWYLRIRKYNFPLLSILFIPIIGYLIHNILLIYEFGID
ncbi:MAG: hypothetical protein KAH95_03640, partial [Spirochaetales bacterium]|nr:hypothetical protein [Spirochaetales bacterium]